MSVPERPDPPPDEFSRTERVTDSRDELVRKAVTIWQGQLVDLGGRNTLLYYKDLKQGTLDLSPGTGADGVRVDDLLASRTVRLSSLFTDADQLQAAAKRARTVRAKAKEMFEERGLGTLYLGWGMATWTSERSAATPAAPVLLRGAAITPRGNAGEDFDIALTDEFEVNPTLLHLLATDYQVRTEADELLDRLDQDTAGAPDPEPLFDHLAKAASAIPGFSISPRVVLGNFSYVKLPMVKDLESAFEELASHDLIAAIAGSAEAREALRARHTEVSPDSPDHIPLADEFLVLDADASQNYAINAVVAGSDLVIDGPPGTGKSQTISNLIASLVARGKKVLFVAEKRAAIDAVMNRIEKVGLSDLVLDLHDGVGNRKVLAQQLARSLTTASQLTAPDNSAHRAQERRRQKLINHNGAMHGRRDPWGVSVFDAQVALSGVAPDARTEIRLAGDELRALDAEVRLNTREALEDYALLGGPAVLAGPGSSTWRLALTTNSIATPNLAAEALDLCTSLSERTLPQTTRLLNAAAESVGFEPTGSFAGWADALQLWGEIRSTTTVFSRAIWREDLATLTSVLAPAGKGAFGRSVALLLNGNYRRQRKLARSLLVEGTSCNSQELLMAVEAAGDQLIRWHLQVLNVPPPACPADLEVLSATYGQTASSLERLQEIAARADLAQGSTGELIESIGGLLEQRDVATNLPELSRLHGELARQGLSDILVDAGERGLTPEQTLGAFDYCWHASVLGAIASSDPRIGAIKADNLDKLEQEFQQGDREHLASTPRRVLRAWAEQAVTARNDFPDQATVVTTQARLKRKFLPPRDLFQAAPDVLLAMKPCWAMSPLVVSHVLPAKPLFDVVVFDEASQILPADAVGSLLRGHQAVVAGDEKQLPPTAFFLSQDGDGDEPDDQANSALVRDMPSLLSQMGSLLPPPKGTRTLSWHYRSRDEELIAFSNAQQSLYDWSLTTFPGVSGESCLRHVLVAFQPDVVGQEESASAEVGRVVDLILEHAAERPDESLGVIAMGIKHADRIDEALRRLRPEHPEVGGFFAEDANEPFFVKNLERVQGDERDAIILTIGYGKNLDGRMLYRFGPINQQGGERRLNVAITRARNRMTLVSSFTSSDMDPDKLRAEGAQMLYRYLRYVESGGRDLGTQTRPEIVMNPFERDVFSQLTRAGIPLVAQLGTSGYRLDFAAKHPRNPGRMVLAIEADGAMYHSAYTARDRDRLRQEHLERLGWRFHRIWSTAWFFDREVEVARAVEAYERAVRIADGEEVPEPVHALVPSPSLKADKRPTARPSVPSGLSINDYSDGQLVAIVQWIQSDTRLRTDDEWLNEVIGDLGFTRRGSRITFRISQAIAIVKEQDAR